MLLIYNLPQRLLEGSTKISTADDVATILARMAVLRIEVAKLISANVARRRAEMARIQAIVKELSPCYPANKIVLIAAMPLLFHHRNLYNSWDLGSLAHTPYPSRWQECRQ